MRIHLLVFIHCAHACLQRHVSLVRVLYARGRGCEEQFGRVSKREGGMLVTQMAMRDGGKHMYRLYARDLLVAIENNGERLELLPLVLDVCLGQP